MIQDALDPFRFEFGLYAGELCGAGYGSFVRLNFGRTRATVTTAIERLAKALPSCLAIDRNGFLLSPSTA